MVAVIQIEALLNKTKIIAAMLEAIIKGQYVRISLNPIGYVKIDSFSINYISVLVFSTFFSSLRNSFFVTLYTISCSPLVRLRFIFLISSSSECKVQCLVVDSLLSKYRISL